MQMLSSVKELELPRNCIYSDMTTKDD